MTVSIKTLAAHLNLSHTTVSRALNDKSTISTATKERVRDAAASMGYVANAGARLVRGMRGRLVGLIIPDVQNDFYSTVAKILAQRCMQEGLQLILAISDDDSALEALHIRAMLEARVAGIIITPTTALQKREAAFLATLPCVQIIRCHELIKAPFISLEDQQGILLATEHLLALGHRRIGFIGGLRALSTASERLSGYEMALAAFNLKVSDKLIALGPPRPEFARAAMKKLLSAPERPTGFVMGSSQLTLGALQAIKESGLTIPDEVSIVGYGDPPWFELAAPALTTLRLPVDDVSAAAATGLFLQMQSQALKNQSVPVQPLLSPRLCVRESTKPVPLKGV